MTREYLLQLLADFTENSTVNRLPALDEDTRAKLPASFGTDLVFYKPPILSVGSAFDPGFTKLREPGVVGPHHLMPTDWLPEARSVISVFLPFTDRLNTSNAGGTDPSWEWLFGRIEGQAPLLAVGELVRDALLAAGYKAHLPYTDPRLIARVSLAQDLPIPVYSSTWSERHVGFVTGLGTFGRSTNFISKAGTSGRLISVVTDWDPAPDVKDYTGVYDYCSECFACYRACPGQAYGESGKTISKCSLFIRENCAKFAPRYGCGKCQAGMPCAARRLTNPNAR